MMINDVGDLKRFLSEIGNWVDLPKVYALANDCQGIFTDQIYHSKDEAEQIVDKDEAYDEVREIIVIDPESLSFYKSRTSLDRNQNTPDNTSQ